MPKVAVLMPVFNGMPYLPAAVESIQQQTYADWKMIIVNDGSTDGSVEYLDSLGDSRIEVIHQGNQGVALALNRGLERCDTEFTARMDDDDVAHPTRFEEQVAFLDQHAHVGLLGTQVRRIGTKRTGGTSSVAFDHETIDTGILRHENHMYHPTIMCRTKILKAIGGYRAFPKCEDTDLYLRMGEITQLANLDRVLLSYRFHSKSMTGSGVEDMRAWVEYACYCASQRRAGRDALNHEEYFASRKCDPLLSRLRKRLEIHARAQYRAGMSDWLNDRPLAGAIRLSYSALWSPSLTLARVRRMVTGRVPSCAARPNRVPPFFDQCVSRKARG